MEWDQQRSQKEKGRGTTADHRLEAPVQWNLTEEDKTFLRFCNIAPTSWKASNRWSHFSV